MFVRVKVKGLVRCGSEASAGRGRPALRVVANLLRCFVNEPVALLRQLKDESRFQRSQGFYANEPRALPLGWDERRRWRQTAEQKLLRVYGVKSFYPRWPGISHSRVLTFG